ncbi:MAG: preprotein translocase subunit SecE [Phycisphaeraceae bacterium]|nr:preprotein translocase subunit SecE [Phycisphaeraceae bacterium]MCB9847090.1 preprotein translocase subunit SecE [Phycisphaeraceae bacterium]
MSFGLYKSGQGYWTRVMSAIGGGTMGLAAASWVWKQTETVKTTYEVIYLQAVSAGIVAILTAILVYWLVGVHRKSSEFLIATEGEMRKVNWSTRKMILGQTWVVIAISLIIAVILFCTDILFAWFFKWINVLQT